MQSEFSQIKEIKGIKKYLLVKSSGRIILGDGLKSENFKGMLLACGREADLLGSTRFTVFLINRKNGEDFLIFPVGNYYLGVIKEKSADTKVLANKVIAFIKDISSRRVLPGVPKHTKKQQGIQETRRLT